MKFPIKTDFSPNKIVLHFEDGVEFEIDTAKRCFSVGGSTCRLVQSQVDLLERLAFGLVKIVEPYFKEQASISNLRKKLKPFGQIGIALIDKKYVIVSDPGKPSVGKRSRAIQRKRPSYEPPLKPGKAALTDDIKAEVVRLRKNLSETRVAALMGLPYATIKTIVDEARAA